MSHYVTCHDVTKKKTKDEWITNGTYRTRLVNGHAAPSVILYNHKTGTKTAEEYYDDKGHLSCRRRFKKDTVITSYYANRVLHNEFLRPAKVSISKRGVALRTEFWKRGKMSRFLGFARIKRSFKDNIMMEEAFLNGVCHSSHGAQQRVYRGGKLKSEKMVIGGKELALKNATVLFEAALMDATLLETCGIPPIPDMITINTNCLLCYVEYSKKRPRTEQILNPAIHAGILIQCTRCSQTVHYRCLKEQAMNGGRCPYCQRLYK